MTDHQADIEQESTDPQYACVQTGDDAYIIYDQQNPTAWIQSDSTNPVAESI